MNPSSTPSFVQFILRGAAAGLLVMGLLVALLCQGCGTERTAVAQKGNHNGYGLQHKRSNAESRRLNDYYNNKQHEKYNNGKYY